MTVPRASLSVRRPTAPSELSPQQAMDWNRIVKSMPADWFTPEMWHLLSVLCVNIDLQRRVAQRLSQAEIGKHDFDKLAGLHNKYTKAISNISSKLRLTPQSRHNVNASRRATKEARAARRHKLPWRSLNGTTSGEETTTDDDA